MRTPSIVLAREWDDEMVDAAAGLQPDRGYEHEDPEFEWTPDDYAEFERESREYAAEQQGVPSWASLFCEESEWGGAPFKCATFIILETA